MDRISSRLLYNAVSDLTTDVYMTDSIPKFLQSKTVSIDLPTIAELHLV